MRCRVLIPMMILVGCSYKPDDPGLCRLNCSKAIIGSNDPSMSIMLKTPTADITCPASLAGQDLSDPLSVQFLINEATESQGGRTGEAVTSNRPTPLLSFEPIVNGLRSRSQKNSPNADFDPATNTYNQVRYVGIITPKTNWCSDTCGVATVEVVPTCPPPGKSSQLSILVHSGALYSEEAKYTISTDE